MYEKSTSASKSSRMQKWTLKGNKWMVDSRDLHLCIYSLRHCCPGLSFSWPIHFFGKVREIDSKTSYSLGCNSFSSKFHKHIRRSPRMGLRLRSLHWECLELKKERDRDKLPYRWTDGWRKKGIVRKEGFVNDSFQTGECKVARTSKLLILLR